MTSTTTSESASRDFASLVLASAEAFPAFIQSRGRGYWREGRVGPLAVEAERVSAQVRGSRTYRVVWQLFGDHADPRCSCPVGPVCKHAYALALAIAESAAIHPSPPVRDRWLAHATRRSPEQRVDELVASDLADWARRRAESHPRTLRAVLGLDLDDTGAPFVWIELRVTTPRLQDSPRSRLQIQQLASELRGDGGLFSPPHARLLRVLARTLNETHGLRETRLRLEPSALNRLLDSFSNSGLVTWQGGDAVAPGPGGIVRGARLRLGESTVDIVPVKSSEESELRLALAARWPDGRLEPLDSIVYLDSDDDLNPSLVLADGLFWRVAEAPPLNVIRRLARGGSLPVPAQGREQFLTALASSFTSVGDALGSHMIVHPAKPVVTMDLGADDWLHVRLFAYAGEGEWRPGIERPGLTVFELAASGEWVKLQSAAESDGGEDAMLEIEAAEAGADLTAGGAAPATDEPDEAASPESSEVWVELPDPEPLVPIREWLATLPFAQSGERLRERRTRQPALADRGGWIHMGASRVHDIGTAWERRPRHVTYLGNWRMRNLLAGPRLIRTRVSVTSSGVDFFAISAEWQAEGLSLTEEDIARLRASPARFVKLSSGWASREMIEGLDAAAATLADLGVELGAGEQRVTLAQLAQASPDSLAALEELGADPATLEQVRRLREAVREFRGLPPVAVPRALKATLRPYQREGLDFLAFVTDLGMGTVLADDMGLGKTVQALAWIEWLRERDPKGGPVLVVCPASVVHNWQREAERFTPELKVLVLASGEERHALRREVPDYDLVITNYALLRRDIEHWRALPLRAAILDEAQNIKNPKAAVSRAVLELQAPHRLALTGTPIENRALDLWSIMEFVNPGYLGRRSEFVARYDRPDAPAWTRKLLAARLRPVLVRRLKEQVAPDLPDRIEERRECQLTPGQRRLYLAELMRGREIVARLQSEGELGEHKIEVLALLTRLRQVCCHPALIGGRADLGSGKFDALFEILEPLMAEGRKVLVFSQFVQLLKLLAPEMKRRGIRCHMLTGETTRREQVVRAFEDDPQPCVFLISLKAGGTGLNLVAARYVVLFDPWWNPAVEAQAIDRAHRIGQTRTVIAYRMLTAETVEEKIWELQQRKQALVKQVLGEDGFARTLTAADLDYLLG